MLVKAVIDEDFTNYKEPCMFIGLGTCTFKCCREQNLPISICQNSPLARQKDIDIPVDEIFHRYISNTITTAIVLGGLEVFDSFEDIFSLINYFRSHGCDDTFVLYTGYYPDELHEKLSVLRHFPNIICKFGRYIQSQQPHLDNVLGVNLASDNQYAKVIS